MTRALILLNEEAPFSGVVAFHAAYPVRVPPGPQPVTVRDAAGRVLPSRVVKGTLTDAPGLPPDKRLWAFELQVLVADVPARTGVAFAATYGADGASEAPEAVWETALDTAPPRMLYETDIHAGDIALPFSLSSWPL